VNRVKNASWILTRGALRKIEAAIVAKRVPTIYEYDRGCVIATQFTVKYDRMSHETLFSSLHTTFFEICLEGFLKQTKLMHSIESLDDEGRQGKLRTLKQTEQTLLVPQLHPSRMFLPVQTRHLP
jgi:hypothetical protein